MKLCPICDQPMHQAPTGYSCGACKVYSPTNPFAELFTAHNMGMTEEQLARFRQAADHPYTCACPLCAEYWSLIPPEPED